MTVETYLQSEEAVAALREMLARCPGGHDSPEWDFYLSAPAEGLRAWWEVRPQPDVTRDNDPPFDRMPVAYFRPDGDRYIVSDLGEAVRALRLRTGRMNLPRGATWEAAAACGAMLDDGVLTMPGHVTAADLPRAIVRVMLAAHRVAALKVPC